MKKIILTFALLLGLTAAALAGETALKVQFTDGTAKTILLSEKPSLSFNGSEMLIATSVATASIDRADVANITFVDDQTTLRSILEEDTPIRISGGEISADGVEITVYDLQGQLVATGTGRADISALSGGIYIIKADNQSLKIKK